MFVPNTIAVDDLVRCWETVFMSGNLPSKFVIFKDDFIDGIYDSCTQKCRI
jgi:hypothetical protein